MQMNKNRGSKIDPLDLLREYTINQKTIKQKDNTIQFDQNKFKLNSQTCFKGKHSKKQYTLGTIWLFLTQKKKGQQQSLREYRTQAEKYGVDIVTKVDEKDMLDYFTGVTDFTESIDIDLKQELIQNTTKKQPQREPVQREYQEGEEPSKKVKMDENLDMMKWLAQTEKPITSKTRLLRSTKNQKFTHLLNFLNNFSSKGKQQINKGIDPTASLPNCILRNIYKTNRKPVIVVPQSHNPGNVSLRNFEKLMIQGVYEDPSKSTNRCMDGRINLKHPINGHNIQFEIIDNIGNIKAKNEWDRIVCVFLSGVKYQINSWPDGDKNAIFFTKKRGYWVNYSTVPPNDFIKQSNCKKLLIQESNRGNDKTIRDEFWKDLQNFLIKPIQ